MRTQFPNLKMFREQILDPVQQFLPGIKAQGVKVLEQTELDDLKNVFAEKRYRVITLLTHCDRENGYLEFFNDMHSPETIVSIIPDDYTGVMDFAVCQGNLAAMKARAQKRCYISWRDKELAPATWLFFYDTLFKLLMNKDVDFMDAIDQTIQLLRGV